MSNGVDIGIKISELESANSLKAGDVLPVVQSGITKKLPQEKIVEAIKNELGSAAFADIDDFATSAAVSGLADEMQDKTDMQNERIDRIEYAMYLISNKGVFKSYRTKALMLADVANIPTNSIVSVVNDPENNADTNDINGEYHYDGNDFFKLPSYDATKKIRDEFIQRVQQQVPKTRTDSSKNLFELTDENGVETWLGVNENGGLTEKALSSIQEAQSFSTRKLAGLVFTDENGVLYDFGLNPDGSLSDRTKDALVGAAGLSINDYYLDSDNKLKKLGAVKTKAAIFGSSTMGLMQPVISAMLQQEYKFIDILQGGRSGERIEQIANRFGAIPVKLRFEADKINATGVTKVSVNFDGLTSMPTANSTLAVTGYIYINHQYIRGTFSYSATDSSFRFTRSVAGAELTAPGEYEFIADQSSYSDAALILLNAGKNNVGYSDEHGTAEYIADATFRMFKHVQSLAKRVVVISHYSNTTSSDALLKIVNDTNEYYRKQYSNLYFDMNAYLMSSQVWIDTAISPNPDDLQKQSEGRLPLSLSRDTGMHLNDVTNIAVVAQLKQFLAEKGWY